MRILNYLYLILILFSCIGKGNISIEEDIETNEIFTIIRISDALLNPQKEMLLSELVDSINYIPIETKKECLLRNYPFYVFTPRNIFYLNYCFDWSGRFLFKAGTLGQGPGEEPSEIAGDLVFCGDNYYTKGQKLIEYDSLGSFTGKELPLYHIDRSKGVVNGNLVYVEAFCSLGENLFLYNYPDTLFVMNKDFEFVSKHFVMSWQAGKMPYFTSTFGPYDRSMTYYKKDLLFYNYFRDTVFQVNTQQFHPKWVIDLEDLKISDEVLYQFNELLRIGEKDYHNGQLDNTPLVKLIDHKYLIHSVNESDKYVFILAEEVFAFRQLRHLPDPPLILVCYNKKTKEIKSTTKIKDDLTEFPKFFPLFGLVDEKMVDVFWPYEHEEWLTKKASTISSLTSFTGRDFSEDNPIVIVAHLKK